MAVFALIGGKRNNVKITNRIEEHLVSLTKKENPTILFCPFAQIHNIYRSINRFKALMANFKCRIVNMTFENLTDFDLLLSNCDIFYVDGGWCDDLVSFFKKNHLDVILSKHLNDNIIFAGSSAGAMLYTRASMGDRYVYYDNFHNYNYKMVDCLNILNITICPHYQNEDLILYNDEVKKYDCDSFGIEEDTMLVITNNITDDNNLSYNRFYVIKEEGCLGIYQFDRSLGYQMIPLYEGVVYEADCSFRS